MLAMSKRLLRSGHEVVCLLSEAFPETIEELRADLWQQTQGVRVATFATLTPCAAHDPRNAWRQMAARLLREHAIACLEPDFVHVPALLPDGWGDDAVASIGELGVYVPVSLTQHDLIPLAMPDIYMSLGPFRDYYMKKVEYTKRAVVLLAISEYSRKEALQYLSLPEDQVVHISSAADPLFYTVNISYDEKARVCMDHGIQSNFLMYAPGGFDPRKNMERLFAAYAMLPDPLRARHQLVLVSKLYPGQREALLAAISAAGLRTDEVVLTDYVSDDDLIKLYAACFLYLFPSIHEGFGLPALEAMLCGAPVLASDASCIPEVIDMKEALFDPFSTNDMAEKILRGIIDNAFRQRLLAHSRVQPKRFSWEASASVAVDVILKKHASLMAAGWKKAAKGSLPDCDAMLSLISDDLSGMKAEEHDVTAFRFCYERNFKAVLS